MERLSGTDFMKERNAGNSESNEDILALAIILAERIFACAGSNNDFFRRATN